MPPQLTNVTVTEGDNLNLTCINNNPFGVSQEWLDSEGNLVSTNATYTVENVTRNAAGVYTCVLTGVNNYTEGHNATVEVQCKFTYDINKLCLSMHNIIEVYDLHPQMHQSCMLKVHLTTLLSSEVMSLSHVPMMESLRRWFSGSITVLR